MELALEKAEEDTLAEHAQLYCELRRYVEATYAARGYPEGMRLLIFCVAYTFLCHQKKTYIVRNLASKVFAPGGKPVKEAYREFARQEKYVEACEYAEERLVAISDAASNEVIKKISGELGAELERGFTTHLPPSKERKYPWLWGPLNFLVFDPALYAIRVILAGFLAALFLASLNLAAPAITQMFQASVREFVVHYLLGDSDPAAVANRRNSEVGSVSPPGG